MAKIKHYFNKHHLILAIAALLLYGNTIRNGYSLDDSIVTEASNITAGGFHAIPKLMRSYYIERAENVKFEYRPLSKVSYAIEHGLLGMNPVISHAINLLLYIACLFLLYRVLLRLFSDYAPSLVFYSVLLFTLMPVHTEVVASLKNREILLCFICSLLALSYFLTFSESGFRRYPSFILSVFFLYLAFLFKMDAMPFLATIPVLCYAKSRQKLRQALIFGILFAASLILYRLTEEGLLEKGNAPRTSFFIENPLFADQAWRYRMMAMCNSLGFYIIQCLVPFKLCCYYGFDTIPVSRISWHGWLGIAALPVLIYGIVRSFRKKDQMLFAGLFIFLAAISMYLNVIEPAVGVVADRFAYTASLGAAITVVALLNRYYQLVPAPPAGVRMAALVMALIFGSVIVTRNRDWKSQESLLQADYRKYPNNAFLYFRTGQNMVQNVEQRKIIPTSATAQRDVFLKARTLVEKSVSIDPSYIVSRSYLCYIDIYLLNDFQAALPQVNIALSQKKTTELYFYKAICMRETSHRDSAEYYLKRCLDMDLAYNNAYNLLSYDYNAAGQYQKSIELYTTAIKKGVSSTGINNGLAKTYWQMGDTTDATHYYQLALDLDPANEEASAMLKRLKKNGI